MSTISRESRRTFTFATLTATAVATCIQLLPTTPSFSDTSITSSTSPYGQSELAQAAQTNTPVVVSSLTTSTSQVTAEPDGTFELVSNETPVRAMTSSGWQAINTSLTRNSDGSVSPKVTTTATTFSGGGTTLLSSVGNSTLGVSTYWPTTLPTPTVSGATTTYPNVRSGVDLVMTANSAGFNETLVVKTPAAAAAINANPIVLSAVGHGVSIVQRPNGSIVGVDSSGNEDFSAPAPAAWDSSTATNAPSDHADTNQSANANVAPLGQISKATAGGAQVTLTVPNNLVNSASTVYPIYVDPQISSEAGAHYLTVENNGWTYFDSSSEPLRVGYCDWAHCANTSGIANSYIQFQTGPLANQPTIAHVISADVAAYEVWNASSGSTPVNLDKSGSFTSSTSYPGPASTTLDTEPSACGWNSANYCYVHFKNQNVADYLQATADAQSWNTFFALTSPDNTNPTYWKKFGDAATFGGDSPVQLTVHYNYPPSQATTPVITGAVSCPGQPTYAPASHFNVWSSAYAYGGDANIGMNFQILTHPLSNNIPAITPNAPIVTASHAPATWAVTGLQDGSYSIDAQAQSESGYSPEAQGAASAYLNFSVDTVSPPAPTVSSLAYPNNYWGTNSSNPGTFTINAPGAAGFTWAFDTGTPGAPSSCTYTSANNGNLSGSLTATNGSATLSPTSTVSTGFNASSLASGHHTLYVRTFDAAHNMSKLITSYDFYVGSGTNPTLVEAESLPVATTNPAGQPGGGNYVASNSTDSGGADSEVVADAPGATVSYTITAPKAGYYALGAQMIPGSHNATVSYKVNTQAAISPQNVAVSADTCNPAQAAFVPLGGFQLTQGANTITLTMTGTGTTSSCGTQTYNGTYGTGSGSATFNSYTDNGYTAGVDFFIVNPLNVVPPQGSGLANAFNNFGIGIDGRAPGDLDLSPNDNALSNAALAAAGITQGSTYTATDSNGHSILFNIPPATANGDNAVAQGQKIDLADPTTGAYPTVGQFGNGGYVDLLVASTCGPINPTAANGFVATFLDATYANPAIPGTVPLWTDTTSSNAAALSGQITTQYYLTGSNASSVSNSAYLYLMKLALPRPQAPRTLQYLTLPDIGTNGTNTCDVTNPALHVFAVTTSNN